MSEQETATHPVYEDLAAIEQKHEVNESAQKAITKVLIGETTIWRELSQKMAVEVVADIQANGFEKVQQWALRGWKKDPSEKVKSQESAIEANERANSSSRPVEIMTDGDTGETIEVTPEMRDEALQVHGQIEGAFWQMANALARIKNEHLYLAMDGKYHTFKEYCADTLPFGVRNAYHYALVGEKIGSRLLEAGDDANSSSHHLERAGLARLRLLASKAEDQIVKLINEGKIQIGDEELTAEEIADQRVKDLRKTLASVEEKAAKAELLEEKLRGKEIENEALTDKLEDAQQWKADHQERADSQDAIGHVIREASRLNGELAGLITQLEPQDMFEVATEAQQEQLVTLLETLKDQATAQCNKHIEVIEFINERRIETEL